MSAGVAQREADGPRVLVVDDDPKIVDLTRVYLERNGIQVVGRTDPEQALAQFDPESFDCVVSDYRMDGPTGVAFCERVQAVGAVPCIVFTSADDPHITAEVESAGFGLVHKRGTDSYDELAARIRDRTDQHIGA
jgi:CheY-like chemotaxis protein